MATINICVILKVSFLIVALQISGNYATKEAELDAEAKSWFKNICHNRNEKLAKIRLYLQDALGGPNATVHEVARASITANSPTAFGLVRVFDDLLTAKPDRHSQPLGKAQGTVISADFGVEALTTVLNFVFTAGKYNGSTISVLGRNQYSDKQRELAVVGGTGVFRFARGYAIETTHSADERAHYGVQKFIVYATYIRRSA